MLLDLRLPDMDGYSVAREMRARSRVPIIMVTAKGEEVDRVIGLELGADDYVVKPFGMRELVARINAVMRRVSENGAARARPGAGGRRRSRWTGAGTEVRLDGARGRADAQGVRPARAARRPTRAPRCDRRTILEEVWGTRWYGPSKTIDVHVSSLRRKLGDPAWIETVRGVGFRLRPP